MTTLEFFNARLEYATMHWFYTHYFIDGGGI